MSGIANLNDIDRALRAGSAAVEALRTWVRGSEAYRICDDRERALRDGSIALDRLSRDWPRIQSLLASAAREYDAYVTRPYDDEPQGCSCHLSAPCSWCTRDADADDAHASQNGNAGEGG